MSVGTTGVGTTGVGPSGPRARTSAGDSGTVAHSSKRLLNPVEKRDRCVSDDVDGDSRNTCLTSSISKFFFFSF